MHLWEGKPYWYNEATGTSTWDDPALSVPPQQKPHFRPIRGARVGPAVGNNTTARLQQQQQQPQLQPKQVQLMQRDQPQQQQQQLQQQPTAAGPALKKSIVVSALKVADQRLDELQAALEVVERDKASLVEELSREKAAEEARAAMVEELTQSLRDTEEDYSELQGQLGSEQQARTLLESKMKAALRDRDKALAKAMEELEQLQADKRRTDRLPSQLLLRFFGGLVGISGSASASSTTTSRRAASGGSARNKKDTGSSPSTKHMNRTLALMRENMTALLDSVASKDEIIRDLAQQIGEYQEESERRKRSYEEIRHRIGGVLEERDRLIDLVEALSLNTCDMAVKTSILHAACAQLAGRLQEIEAEKESARELEKESSVTLEAPEPPLETGGDAPSLTLTPSVEEAIKATESTAHETAPFVEEPQQQQLQQQEQEQEQPLEEQPQEQPFVDELPGSVEETEAAETGKEAAEGEEEGDTTPATINLDEPEPSASQTQDGMTTAPDE